jgi:hypothetical protein
MSMSGFLYRDIVKFILPTLIGICLIGSFFEINLQDTSAFLIAVFVGFLFSGLLSSINIIHWIPKIKEREKVKKMMINNWDYDLMFYSLDKDDRDYLYLSGSYLQFYITTVFYLFIYLIINILYFIPNFYELNGSTFLKLLNLKTTIIGGIEINSCIVFLLVGIALIFLLKYYILEYEILYFPFGQYDTLARKMQLKNVNIILIKSIWGKIIRSNKGLEGNLIYLKENGTTVESCETNSYGYFQFNNVFEKYKGKPNLKIETTIDKITHSWDISLSINSMPYYEFKV